jgi:hypothetical protein
MGFRCLVRDQEAVGSNRILVSVRTAIHSAIGTGISIEQAQELVRALGSGVPLNALAITKTAISCIVGNPEAAFQVARDLPPSGRHMPSANGEIRYSL